MDGHVTQSIRLAKNVLQGTMKGKRRRGRQKGQHQRVGTYQLVQVTRGSQACKDGNRLLLVDWRPAIFVAVVGRLQTCYICSWCW